MKGGIVSGCARVEVERRPAMSKRRSMPLLSIARLVRLMSVL